MPVGAESVKLSPSTILNSQYFCRFLGSKPVMLLKSALTSLSSVTLTCTSHKPSTFPLLTKCE